MITKIHIPNYPLNQFIDHFFYYTSFNPEHSVDRFLPDGEVQLIFDLADYPKYVYDNETLKRNTVLPKCLYSHKHVCKIFKENLSVTPKTFLKIIRFQKAMAEGVKGILKDEFYVDQTLTDMAHAKRATKNAFNLFNEIRLHLSLDYKTSNMVYQLSA